MTEREPDLQRLSFVRTPSIGRAFGLLSAILVVSVVDTRFDAWWTALIGTLLWLGSWVLVVPSREHTANVLSILLDRPVAVTDSSRQAIQLPAASTSLRLRALLWLALTLSIVVLSWT